MPESAFNIQEFKSFKVKDIEIKYGMYLEKPYFSASDICSVSGSDPPENIFDVLKDQFISDKISHYTKQNDITVLYFSYYQALTALNYLSKSPKIPIQPDIISEIKKQLSEISGFTEQEFTPVTIKELPPKKLKKSALNKYTEVKFVGQIKSVNYRGVLLHYGYSISEGTTFFLAKDLLVIFYGPSFTMGAPSMLNFFTFS